MKTRPLALTAVLAAALVITGCSTADPAPEAHQAAEEAHVNKVAEITETQTVAEEEPVDDTPTLSPRGFIPKELGEAGGLLDGETPVVEFTLTEIKYDYQCDQYAMSSENGSFIGLHFEVEVFPEWADQNFQLGSFMMTDYDFQGFDTDGQRVNDVQGTAFSCATHADQLPNDIGPGQTASGWIVLDIPEETAIIAYVLPYDGIGMEWQLP